ncbi:hypothetical protein [Rhizobium sp. OAE497]|uniref:hypothetical protein n=1 Tax=Rhizobium sp. OAE497 TaxID=2663796 RepID=UPI0018F69550
MISEIAAWLFALFVVDPLHAEIRERVDAANLPVQALQQSQQCVAAHGPRLLQRAGEEPVWATGTAIGIATGWTSPTTLFDTSDPNCAALTQIFQGERGDAEA